MKFNIIVAADIFGESSAFKELCQQISSGDLDSSSINYHFIGPYEFQPDSFLSEQHAYQYFIEHVGIEAYSQKLFSLLERINGPTLLIGFSVGGSAIWRLLPRLKNSHGLSAICFYSGQIRAMTEINPSIPCRLIFPSSETHFSVPELLSSLHEKKLISIEKSNWLHGFMNKQSVNYNQDAYQHYLSQLVALCRDKSIENNR